jgi:hypothetical protein
MPDIRSIIPDAGGVIMPAIIGAVVSYIGAIFSNALSYRAKVDEGLREKRIELYRILWKKTDLLPKWPPRTDLTYEMLSVFSEELRAWYFDEGGIFLSSGARKAYGKLQDSIGEVFATAPRGPISAPDYEKIRRKCSSLRSQLTEDLLSRRTAPRWVT